MILFIRKNGLRLLTLLPLFILFPLFTLTFVLAGDGGISGSPGDPTSNIASGKSTSELEAEARLERETELIQETSRSNFSAFQYGKDLFSSVKINKTTEVYISVNQKTGGITLHKGEEFTKITDLAENLIPENSPYQASITPIPNAQSVFITVVGKALLIHLNTYQKSEVIQFTSPITNQPLAVTDFNTGNELIVFTTLNYEVYFLNANKTQELIRNDLIPHTYAFRARIMNPLQQPTLVRNLLGNLLVRVPTGTGGVFYLNLPSPHSSIRKSFEIHWMENNRSEAFYSEVTQTSTFFSGKGTKYLKISKVEGSIELNMLQKIASYFGWNAAAQISYVAIDQTILSEPLVTQDQLGRDIVVVRTKDYFKVFSTADNSLVENISIQKPIKDAYNEDGNQLPLKFHKNQDGTEIAILETPGGGIYIINKGENNLKEGRSTIHRFNPQTKQEKDKRISNDISNIMILENGHQGVMIHHEVGSTMIALDLENNRIYNVSLLDRDQNENSPLTRSYRAMDLNEAEGIAPLLRNTPLLDTQIDEGNEPSDETPPSEGGAVGKDIS